MGGPWPQGGGQAAIGRLWAVPGCPVALGVSSTLLGGVKGRMGSSGDSATLGERRKTGSRCPSLGRPSSPPVVALQSELSARGMSPAVQEPCLERGWLPGQAAPALCPPTPPGSQMLDGGHMVG